MIQDLFLKDINAVPLFPHSELIIDAFAGGGGASTGIERALGRSPDIAINHCDKALTTHAANHPDTIHLREDVFDVDLKAHTSGLPVGLLWASPDCRHFSKAGGGRIVSEKVRMLAWSVVNFCQKLGKRKKPRVIILENVAEFAKWGPLGPNGKPIKSREGETFNKWCDALRKLGYKVEHRLLKACDYGAPTIRERLFLVARCDRKPIVWPAPTHGNPKAKGFAKSNLKPWRPAAEIIDWSLPCHSIFLSKEEGRKVGVKRPLSDNTMRRIALGTVKYVLNAQQPFIFNMSHGGRIEPLTEPLRTTTTTKGGERLLVVPFVKRDFKNSVGHAIDDPLATVTAGGGGHACLVSAFLAQHNSGVIGRSVSEPLSTVMKSGSHQALVTSHLLSLKGTSRRSQSIFEPAPTITAGGMHAAEVRAFLIKYYGSNIGQSLDDPIGTVTTRDRFGLVTVNIAGEPYIITDICMRMLSARELYRAQGFYENHEIRPIYNGRPLPKKYQVAQCGNSVSPDPAEALVASNCPDLCVRGEA
ncbi:type II DNA modification methyltransferase [Pseudovibrio japonicus]|uniref:DNA (cytosine-5-)-methyltransferase n=1 Tax=Pseudovibrio japonicus TaxID=366534 RepID=A0ABQ3ED28_9HYPH|nr:DNA cytosine methyltransferase [Pseudovibrio japonicus]GHB33888.1 type II DNA modification methyltransferase [Pseudovibrio japonicus]